MTLLRRVVFYVFAAFYVIFCPLVLLYSFGRSLRPADREFLTETGLISLATVPSGANVHFNGSPLERRTPTVIQDLLPGRYDVRIEMRGYLPWTRTLTVEPNEATVFEKIIMVPDSWSKKTLATEEFVSITPIPNTSSFIAAQSSHVGDLWFVEPERERMTRLVDEEPSLGNGSVLSCTTTPGSRRLLLTVQDGDERRAYWLRVQPSWSVEISDATGLFRTQASETLWEPNKADYLYQAGAGYVHRSALGTASTDAFFLNGVKGFGVSDRDLYVLDNEGTLWQSDHDLKGRRVLDNTDTEQFRNEIRTGGTFFRIYPLSRDIVLIASRDGSLTVNRPPYRLLSEDFRGFSFSNDSQRLLFWSRKRIGVADLWEDPLALERNPLRPLSVSWVYAGGADLRQAYWAYDGSHVLTNDGGRIVLIDTQDGSGRVVAAIGETSPGAPFAYDDLTGVLCYIDSTTQSLISINVVKREFLPGIIPREIRDIFVHTKKEE